MRPFKMIQRDVPQMRGYLSSVFSVPRNTNHPGNQIWIRRTFKQPRVNCCRGQIFFRAGVRFGTRIINLRRQGPAVFESRWRQSSEDVHPLGGGRSI